jgi:hypothetical protein
MYHFQIQAHQYFSILAKNPKSKLPQFGLRKFLRFFNGGLVFSHDERKRISAYPELMLNRVYVKAKLLALINVKFLYRANQEK